MYVWLCYIHESDNVNVRYTDVYIDVKSDKAVFWAENEIAK